MNEGPISKPRSSAWPWLVTPPALMGALIGLWQGFMASGTYTPLPPMPPSTVPTNFAFTQTLPPNPEFAAPLPGGVVTLLQPAQVRVPPSSIIAQYIITKPSTAATATKVLAPAPKQVPADKTSVAVLLTVLSPAARLHTSPVRERTAETKYQTSTVASPPVAPSQNPQMVAQQMGMIKTLLATLKRLAGIEYVRDPATQLYLKNPDGSVVQKSKSPFVSVAECTSHAVAALNAILPKGIHIELADARNMAAPLFKAGFEKIATSEGHKIGDVLLIIPSEAMVRATPTGKIVPQHMAVWDGSQWVSDYYAYDAHGHKMNQDNAWPFFNYPKSFTMGGKPAFTTITFRNHIVAAAADTFTAALNRKELPTGYAATSQQIEHPNIPGYQSTRITVSYSGLNNG